MGTVFRIAVCPHLGLCQPTNSCSSTGTAWIALGVPAALDSARASSAQLVSGELPFPRLGTAIALTHGPEIGDDINPDTGVTGRLESRGREIHG